jgi:mannosyltransferase OCH1-like enzyme
MTATEPDRENHRARSAYVRGVVQRTGEPGPVPAAFSSRPRRTIVQFWDDLKRLPGDVGECIESWKKLEARGFEVRLFDNDGARELIASRLGPRHENAYRRCYHPAMQSDYFRLCYILVEGGCYLDADDVHNGPAIERLFDDGRLKIQPLCYDVETDQMVPPKVFCRAGSGRPDLDLLFQQQPAARRPRPPHHRAGSSERDRSARASD